MARWAASLKEKLWSFDSCLRLHQWARWVTDKEEWRGWNCWRCSKDYLSEITWWCMVGCSAISWADERWDCYFHLQKSWLSSTFCAGPIIKSCITTSWHTQSIWDEQIGWEKAMHSMWYNYSDDKPWAISLWPSSKNNTSQQPTQRTPNHTHQAWLQSQQTLSQVLTSLSFQKSELLYGPDPLSARQFHKPGVNDWEFNQEGRSFGCILA